MSATTCPGATERAPCCGIHLAALIVVWDVIEGAVAVTGGIASG